MVHQKNFSLQRIMHEPIGHNCCFEKAGAKEELMEQPGMKGM